LHSAKLFVETLYSLEDESKGDDDIWIIFLMFSIGITIVFFELLDFISLLLFGISVKLFSPYIPDIIHSLHVLVKSEKYSILVKYLSIFQGNLNK
jgi:hypothetical protein